MKLIVGLGNPGKEYEKTRHNVGFIIIDEIAKKLGVTKYEAKFKAYYTKVSYKGETVILLKPQTFMNLSGASVSEVISYFKIDIEDILIVYDDLDLDVGKLRFKGKSSNGGHNGIRSIESCLGTSEFKRLKFGIGRDKNIPTAKYVLGKFSKDSMDVIVPSVELATQACLDFTNHDFLVLMSKYN